MNCKLLPPLGHVVVEIPLKCAAAEVSGLRREGPHYLLSEGQTRNRLFNQNCDIAHTSFIKFWGTCKDELKRSLLIARDLPEKVC